MHRHLFLLLLCLTSLSAAAQHTLSGTVTDHSNFLVRPASS